MLDFWLIPAPIVLVFIVALLYLAVRAKGGDGVRREGRIVHDRPTEDVIRHRGKRSRAWTQGAGPQPTPNPTAPTERVVALKIVLQHVRSGLYYGGPAYLGSRLCLSYWLGF